MKIENWDRWQTFRKDRGTPPWIKVYRNLMTNEAWVSLSDSEKGQLVSMWILAADKDGKIPDNAKTIQRMAMLDKAPNLNKFMDLGFLVTSCQPDVNQVVTSCRQSDAPEESRDRVETEKSGARKKRASHLPADFELADDYRDYCKEKRPELNPDVVFENFKDYYLSVGKPMVDWKRTWQRWVRNERQAKTNNGYQAPDVFSQAHQKADINKIRQADKLLDPTDPYAELKVNS